MLSKLLRNWTPCAPAVRIRFAHRAVSGGYCGWKTARCPRMVRLGTPSGRATGTAPNQVEVYDNTGALVVAFNAFPGFKVVQHVVLGDVNGDGVPDIVVGAGYGGGPEVKVYDGAAIALGGASAQTAIDTPLKKFYAYAPNFTGGVNVAVGNINGQTIDGTATGAPLEDIVTGPAPAAARK